MAIVFSLPPCTAVRGYGTFHDISMGFGDYLCSWRLFVLDMPPKTSIFGHLRVKADKLSCGEGYGRVIDLSEGQGLIPYMEIHVLLRVKVDHLTTLTPDTVSSILISTLHEAINKSAPALFRPVLFQNLIKNVNRKNAGNQEKTVSSVGTGKEILLNC